MTFVICSFSENLNSEEKVLIIHEEYESGKIVVSFWGYTSHSILITSTTVKLELSLEWITKIPLYCLMLYRFQTFFKKELTGTFSSNKCNHA